MEKIIIIILISSAILGNAIKPNYEQPRSRVIFISGIQEAESTPTPAPKPKTKMAMVLPSQQEVAQKVKGIFTEDPETAVAVFRAESGLRPDAQGWNCMYNGISLPCRPEDRPRAWSTDCGVAQINTPGTTCPEELFEIETNLRKAKAKYESRGWQPWSAWKAGKHLVFLQ